MHPLALFNYLLILNISTKSGLKQQTTMTPLDAHNFGLLLHNKIFQEAPSESWTLKDKSRGGIIVDYSRDYMVVVNGV